jgi:hypothetical protein
MASDEKSGRGCLLVILAVAGVVGLIFRNEIKAAYLSRPFPEPKLREFAAAESLGSGEGTVQPGELPYRSGKVVLVIPASWTTDFGASAMPREIDPPRLHADFFKLSSSVRAGTPEEVSTVIVCRSMLKTVGQYVAGTPAPVPTAQSAAKQQFVSLKVYDMKKRVYVGEAELVGSFPKSQVAAGESKVGERADVAGWVARMPVR